MAKICYDLRSMSQERGIHLKSREVNPRKSKDTKPISELDTECEPTAQELARLESRYQAKTWSREEAEELLATANRNGQEQAWVDQDYSRLLIYQMTKTPLLTPEEEIALGKLLERASEKDATDEDKAIARDARNRLVLANVRLVLSVAQKYLKSGLPLEDLFQAGVEGLIAGVEKWDYKRGHRISTYVTWWIWQRIRRAPHEQSRPMRISVHAEDKLAIVHRIKAELYQTQELEPSVRQIADRILDLGIAGRFSETIPKKNYEEQIPLLEKWIIGLLAASVDPLELDRDVSNENDTTFGEAIADSDAIAPEEWVTQENAREEIRKMLDSSTLNLNEKERTALQMIYGFYPNFEGVEYSQAEVAEELDLSEVYIRQLLHHALKKIKKHQGALQISKDMFD